MDPTLSYQLPKEIINYYKELYPNPFASKSSISAFTFMRTYSRNIYNGFGKYLGNESFFDVCIRCVNGTMSIAKNNLGPKWDEVKWTNKAAQMLEMFLKFELLPSGRNLWALGTELVHSKGMYLSLFNCAFHTSKNIEKVGAEFFCFNMDALMLGAGVGYDDLGAGKLIVKQPELAPYRPYKSIDNIRTKLKQMLPFTKKIDPKGMKYLKYELDYIDTISSIHRNNFNVHVIQDDREGWVNALRVLINSYLQKNYITIFDYSKIREAGVPLKTFGGMSSGPQPLAEGLAIIRHLLQSYINRPMDSLLIADISNIIAMIVVSGNVRRSSQIFVFENVGMCEIKDFNSQKYKYRTMTEAWASNSNNSFKLTDELTNADYATIIDQLLPLICTTCEPGIFNRDLCRKYGRIIDGPGDFDPDIDGTNPCGEISLAGTSKIASDKPYSAGGELCNLVEIIIANVPNPDRLQKVAKMAYIIAKMVASSRIHWKATDEIQQKNFRLGISQTGIVEYLSSIDYNMETYAKILDRTYKTIKQYDQKMSPLFGLPLSRKLTTVKPSGTLSLVAGVSSGMHAIRGKYFIRRIRLAKNKHDYINVLQSHGIHIEDDVNQSNTTVVASFPVKYSKDIKTKAEFDFNQQIALLETLQTYWSDNSVSCTLEFYPTPEGCAEVKKFLLEKRNVIKGVSFAPIVDYGTIYPQMPQEIITEDQYNEMMTKITPFTDLEFLFRSEQIEEETDNYCTGDSCMMKPSVRK